MIHKLEIPRTDNISFGIIIQTMLECVFYEIYIINSINSFILTYYCLKQLVQQTLNVNSNKRFEFFHVIHVIQMFNSNWKINFNAYDFEYYQRRCATIWTWNKEKTAKTKSRTLATCIMYINTHMELQRYCFENWGEKKTQYGFILNLAKEL